MLFTSARAVDALVAAGIELGGPTGPRLGAVGPATARRLAKAGGAVDLVPERHGGAALGRALLATLATPEHTRVLLPRSDRALADLPALLAEASVPVSEVVAYQSRARSIERHELERLGMVDAFLVASPTAAEGLLGTVGAERFRALYGAALVAAIGPSTAQALQSRGLPAGVVAARSTFDALLRAAAERLGGE